MREVFPYSIHYTSIFYTNFFEQQKTIVWPYQIQMGLKILNKSQSTLWQWAGPPAASNVPTRAARHRITAGHLPLHRWSTCARHRPSWASHRRSASDPTAPLLSAAPHLHLSWCRASPQDFCFPHAQTPLPPTPPHSSTWKSSKPSTRHCLHHPWCHLTAPPPEFITRHVRFGATVPSSALSQWALPPSDFHPCWPVPHFPCLDCVLQDHSIAAVAHWSASPPSIHAAPHRGPTPSVSLHRLEVARQVPLVP
jgi:hypothetical protein